jgi:hypothetical protein
VDSAAKASASRFNASAAQAPNVGDGGEFEVLFFGILQKGGNQRALHALAAADDSGTDAIIWADDGSIAFCVPGDRSCGQRRASQLQEFSSTVTLQCHVFSLFDCDLTLKCACGPNIPPGCLDVNSGATPG